MEFVGEYIESFGIMAMLAIAFGAVLRSGWPSLLRQGFVGALFGLAAIFAMMHRIALGEGVFVDPRNIFVGFSAAFLGPLGALVTVGIAAGYRVLIGGAGVYAGCCAMMLSGGAGLLWAWMMARSGEGEVRTGQLLALGMMLSVEIFGALLLPPAMIGGFYAHVAVFVVGMDVVNGLIMGAFIERERRLAGRELQLRAAAITDPLTGLLNRRGFDQAHDRLRAGSAPRGYVVLAVDLDHFKHLNDVYGHDGGDAILTAVARALRRRLPAEAILSRFGGEEFVAVLRDRGRAEGEAQAEALRQAIEDLAQEEGRVAERVTASVGGCWVASPDDLTRGLTLSDRALYEAKRLGRNRVSFSSGLQAEES